MNSKFVSAILSVLVVAPLMAGFLPVASAQVTLPDTTCASAVGVGADDIPHAYYTANGIVTTTNDACPTHYSGELGFGIGGVWLFAREGPSVNGGDGVVACYGSTTPGDGPTTGHHGTADQTTIAVRDDVFGGAVAFTVTRDYNRSESDPFLPSSNNAGDFDCGDSLVEPCAAPGDENVAPGCNPLDDSQFVFPQPGLCEGLASLGDLFNPPTDPTLIDLIVNFVLSLLGIVNGNAACEIPPGPNKWSNDANNDTIPDSLDLYAGADGAIVLFIQSNFRADAGHFGAGTTGAVWTQSSNVPVSGNCTLSPALDVDGQFRLYTCTYVGKDCTWVYRSDSPQPRQPSKDPNNNPWNDFVISKTC